MKEQKIIRLAEFMETDVNANVDEDLIPIATRIYEKFIEPLEEKIKSHHKRYHNSFETLSKAMTEYMSAINGHLYNEVKEKDEEIAELKRVVEKWVQQRGKNIRDAAKGE